jgi:hypothetical protein
MLRFGYLDSEFDPTALFWGDETDLRSLARSLGQFVENLKPQELTGQVLHAQTGHTLRLIPARSDSVGLVRSHGGNGFEWRLTAELAQKFILIIEELASCDRAAHNYLDCDGDELTVRISLREYPDDFLLH